MNFVISFFVWIMLISQQVVLGDYVEYGIPNANATNYITYAWTKALPIFKAAPCMGNLLRQVVSANRRFYDPKKHYYSLSYQRKGNQRYLVIESGEYKRSKVFDYVGVIKFNGHVFLCRGDIAAEAIFKREKGAFLTVHLEKGVPSDEVEFGSEPSLRGLYQECSGIEINLEVYTRAKLLGFKMEERGN